MNFKILVVDDEAIIRNSINRVLEPEGYQVELAESGEKALEIVPQLKPDLILLDLRMDKINGLEVLHRIKSQYPEIIIIMITAYASIESAVEAMKAGAYDYIQKPFTADQLRLEVSKALHTLTLKKQVEDFRHRQMERNRFNKIIGNSEELQNVLKMVRLFAPSNTTILIEGESGTGKELVAEYIHYLSPRYAKPFVPLNCAAVNKNLLESELFGYDKGAFTGASSKGKTGIIEQADGGTLFLDEVGEMSLEAQVKFLRVLENGEMYRVGNPQSLKVDLRVIAATNRPLEKLVKEGKFRDDLFYRLNIAKIVLPPLRERKADIIPLTKFFIETFNKKFGKKVKGISSEVEDILLSHPLKGNVRELRNMIERVLLLSNSEIIQVEDLTMAGISAEENSFNILVKFGSSNNGNVLHYVYKELIQKTLAIAKGNKSQAARLLGIPRSTLRHYLSRVN